jgi:hypothetical protein
MTMLLYKTAVVPLKAERDGWFVIGGIGGVIDFDDAKFACNELTSLPVARTSFEDALVVGLHDDEELCENDPRFNHEADETNFAVVRSPVGRFYMLLLAITYRRPVCYKPHMSRAMVARSSLVACRRISCAGG